jgi:hypothetical protein
MNIQYAISGNQRNNRCFILVCIGLFRGGGHRMRKSECGIRKDVFNIPHSAFRIPHSTFRIPLKPRGRSAFTKIDFTGRIFGHMLFELFAPQTLKCVATTIQCFRFGKIGRFTAQIAKLKFVGCHTGIPSHIPIPRCFFTL